jgi:hypothetical protein
MRKLLSITAIAAIAVVALVPAASANPFVPDPPKKGHASYKWLSYGCKMNSQGQTRAHASIETWVRKLKSKYGMYRQKVKVQIDKQVGFSDTNPSWREVDSATSQKDYWFQKNSGLAPGSRGSLPDGIRSSVRTGMQPDQAVLTAKATIWLKRYGLPNSVWRYKVRSPKFTCPGIGGMELPAAEALPFANGS